MIAADVLSPRFCAFLSAAGNLGQGSKECQGKSSDSSNLSATMILHRILHKGETMRSGEIKKKYRNQWVLIRYSKLDTDLRVKEG